MKTILITGASGFIGREVTGALLQKGHNIIGTDVKASPFIGQPNFNFLQTSIIDKGKILPLLESGKLDAVIHLACSCDNDLDGIITDKEMKDSAAVDKYLYKAAITSGIKDVMLLSTTQVYAPQKTREPVRETSDEKPFSNYAKMKSESEKELGKSLKKGGATRGVVMRVAPVYSKDYNQNLHDKIYDYKDGVGFLYGEGNYGFSFCCVYNLVDFINGILSQDGSYQYQGIYNICDTKPTMAKDIVEFERDFHKLGAVISRNYSADAIKAALANSGKKPKTDYRYVDLSTLTSNINYDNTKAQRISTFRWNLSNTK
ncbi:MAG: NAD(P)-dependent oxidoreductase [Ruminococcus sp.]|nr:NAD(P)-dependent oxidoreductase [Ruminococcus sp.]